MKGKRENVEVLRKRDYKKRMDLWKYVCMHFQWKKRTCAFKIFLTEQ